LSTFSRYKVKLNQACLLDALHAYSNIALTYENKINISIRDLV
jgi:hypothetical protein